MLEDLRKLTGFQPESGKQDNVARLLDYVEERLRSRGLKVERLQYEGVNSLYASVSGNKHARVMFQGHVDVVPGGDSYRREGDKVYGRGAYDMLFGTAALLKLIEDVDVSQLDFSVMLVGDEETGGFNGARALLNEGGYSADVCVLPDAGPHFGALNIGAKGVYQPTIQINGRSHHGSRPWEGDGAASKLVKFLTKLETVFDASDQANSTMTVATLQSGEALNQGPATALVGLDIRYKDKNDLVRIEAKLASLLEAYDGVIVDEHRANDFQLPMDNPYVQRFLAVYESVAGSAIELTKAHGSSDARFFAEKNIPVIMFRPNGGNAHGDGEWLSVKSLEKFYEVLRAFIVETSATREAT